MFSDRLPVLAFTLGLFFSLSGRGHADGLSFVQSLHDVPITTSNRAATSPDGRHIYVNGDEVLGVLSRDATTGALSLVEHYESDQLGVDGLDSRFSTLVVSSDGRHVYAGIRNDDALLVFERDLETGSLSLLEVHFDGVDGLGGLRNIYHLTLSPDDRHIFVTGAVQRHEAIFERDTASGRLTFLGTIDDLRLGFSSAAVVSPDGQFLYILTNTHTEDEGAVVMSYSFDPTTGATNLLDVTPAFENLSSGDHLVISPDGRHIYAISSSSTTPSGDSVAGAVSALARDASTGALSFIGAWFDGIDGIEGLASLHWAEFSPDGRQLYVASYMSPALRVPPSRFSLAIPRAAH